GSRWKGRRRPCCVSRSTSRCPHSGGEYALSFAATSEHQGGQALRKINSKRPAISFAALATFGLGGVWAHASSSAPADAADTVKPLNAISKGISTNSFFKTVGGALNINCKNNVADVKTPYFP